MDNKMKEMCENACMNARALEEILLTVGHLAMLSRDDAEDVVERCEQIAHCMRTYFNS